LWRADAAVQGQLTDRGFYQDPTAETTQ
jgi:hypothetical protein